VGTFRSTGLRNNQGTTPSCRELLKCRQPRPPNCPSWRFTGLSLSPLRQPCRPNQASAAPSRLCFRFWLSRRELNDTSGDWNLKFANQCGLTLSTNKKDGRAVLISNRRSRPPQLGRLMEPCPLWVNRYRSVQRQCRTMSAMPPIATEFCGAAK
jgi:hypothetical protein